MIRIIGCGNLIAGDDAVGIHIIQKLREYSLPEGTELIEGGVRGLDLVEYFLGADKIIIADAVAFGGTRGECRKFEFNDLIGMSRDSIVCLHQIGIAEVIKVCSSLYPEETAREVILIGVEIGKVEHAFSMELSPEIEEAVPVAVNMILTNIVL